jgi:multidrug efflux pump subunit AcrB
MSATGNNLEAGGHPLGIAGRIAKSFINSKLTPLGIVAALVLGLIAVMQIPREEEPQIVVPMLDVMTAMPGASAAEVEKRVTTPLEMILREIPGVEYVYSTSSPGRSLIIVRFLVGTPQEDAVVRVYTKLYANLDHVPPGVMPSIVKSRSIDDVPILALTLWGKNYNSYQLRRIAAELEHSIKQVQDVSETSILGGQPRELRVELSSARLASYGLSPGTVVRSLQAANARVEAGQFASGNQQVRVDAGSLFTGKQDVEQTVVGVSHGHSVLLGAVAERIEDGPAEAVNYVDFGVGRGALRGNPKAQPGTEYPAVTITVAKRKGTNATNIANAVLARVAQMRGTTLPDDLEITTTRNYGETAKAKSDELLYHLAIATFSVTLLIAVFLGWRESGVVLLAIPVTLALTLGIFYLLGYTLNRVTLFALIFSIGILVDDAIVVVENIVRHFRLPENKGRPLGTIAIEAVAEVGNPTILATFAVIAAILPMASVSGLMGPYMMPIPVGASSAMLFSLLVAFVVSPWASLRLLRHAAEHKESQPDRKEDWATRLYRRVMTPMVHKRRWRWRWLFLLAVVVLLLAAVSLVPLKWVQVKMLPFDNKSEFQVIINMPDGTTLEQTARVGNALGAYLAQQPEVENYQLYAGLSGPYNFNGLVRHYYLRHQPNQADIQVNLLPKEERSAQSHAIAKRLRPALDKIAAPYGARIEVSEVPPGPPVIQTLVAEVYGPQEQGQIALARKIKQIFKDTPGVVDVDWYVEDPQRKVEIIPDEEKAALHGLSTAQVSQALETVLHGSEVGLLHSPTSREDVPVVVRMSRADRSSVEALESTKLAGSDGTLVSLREITRVEETTLRPSIYHKNMKRVVYVTGDVAGVAESPVYAIFEMNKALKKLTPGGYALQIYNAVQPPSTDRYAMKWDGEWHITIEVFRDLGVAFGMALLLIYVLVVGWFRSFIIPLVIMAPIPLTLVGILPAHALMGAFFTATSMIGFIAGAGIIVRNSIILVDFIELRRRQGMELADAVVEAGVVRFRPMLLTAAAVVVGASVILSDPIFQGLALSLMAGEVASTLLSRMAVPILYYMVESKLQHEPGKAS